MSRTPKPRRLAVVRYLLDGKQVPKNTPGAVRTPQKTRTWYATLPGDRRPTSLGTEDLGRAWVELNRLLRERADREAGIATEAHDHARRPLSEHLDDWRAAVVAGGCSEAQADMMRGRWSRLMVAAGWTRLGDLSAERCLAALQRLQRERFYHGAPQKPPSERAPNRDGRAPQTRNYYLAHAKQFARWCVDTGRLARNPFAGLKPVSADADRRHERRCPEPAEVVRLFDHLAGPGAPAIRGMSAACRALGYKVMMATGFRAAELRALTPDSFDLDEGTATVPAGYSKRKRRDTQELPDWLVLELREWFGSGGGCWGRFPRHLGKVLQQDLEAAGIEYAIPGPDGPQYLDAHSFRVWYISALADQPGISPKTLMELARHSDPRLTLVVYAKSKRHNLKAAVEKIPNPVRPVTKERRKEAN